MPKMLILMNKLTMCVYSPFPKAASWMRTRPQCDVGSDGRQKKARVSFEHLNMENARSLHVEEGTSANTI